MADDSQKTVYNDPWKKARAKAKLTKSFQQSPGERKFTNRMRKLFGMGPLDEKTNPVNKDEE